MSSLMMDLRCVNAANASCATMASSGREDEVEVINNKNGNGIVIDQHLIKHRAQSVAALIASDVLFPMSATPATTSQQMSQRPIP